ncbi:MAG: calcium-translocating P-type ATPase, SERCA-type [bacterium]
MLANKEYYLLDKEELVENFNFSMDKGLSNNEVRKRQYQYGKNLIEESNHKNVFSIFFNQFKDFMIIVLLVATSLSLLMGEFTDGITIFAIVILNGIMGFVQEYKAEKSLEELKKLSAPEAKVIRDGEVVEINAEELVPGDLLLLEIGDKIPADCRLLSSNALQIDESLLTGESIPVDKSDKNLYRRGIELVNQLNMIFMGTAITRGNCKAVVVSTGMDTEMGKIAHLLGKKNNELTPLQKRLKNLGKWLVILSLLITIAIVIVGILKGRSAYHMFMAGVSLAVAAIPEGLPAIVTLVLAIGVQKMIKSNAIVRKLPAVETLGCSTVICSDKTGTLTQNKMTLKKVYIDRMIKDFDSADSDISLEKLLKISSLCTTVELKGERKKGAFNKVKEFFTGSSIPDMLGDPTEIALVRAYYQAGYSFGQLKDSYKIKAEESFNSERKRMSILVEDSLRKKELWIKGAPEVILNRCSYIEIDGKKRQISSEAKKQILRANDNMAGEALRVLAVAYREFHGETQTNKLDKYENNLTFLGLVAFIDPPRPEVYQAVKKCYQAGIKPVMITGDHKITASVIAKDIGIITKGSSVITGEQLKEMDDDLLEKKAKNIQVFARISPEDKLRIVKALKKSGEVVAMTGDGVNDAPAVKEADIGIAMGKKGTDVTKEVSSLILADDNFATIVDAIREGRKIYNNIRKFIKYLLACNIGELLAIFIGVFLGLPLPLLPIQILWVNLVTDGLPALALGLDNDSDDVMKKPPRDPEESIFAHGMVNHIVSQGALIGISTMTAFLIAIYRLGLDLNTARTMAFSTLVFSQLFFVFSCRSEEHSFWELSPFSNVYLLFAVLLSAVMQIAVIYVPLFSSFFNTKLSNLQQWMIVIILAIWSTIIIDLIRNFLRSRKKAR